jgi:hypothetical protein
MVTRGSRVQGWTRGGRDSRRGSSRYPLVARPVLSQPLLDARSFRGCFTYASGPGSAAVSRGLIGAWAVKWMVTYGFARRDGGITPLERSLQLGGLAPAAYARSDRNASVRLPSGRGPSTPPAGRRGRILGRRTSRDGRPPRHQTSDPRRRQPPRNLPAKGGMDGPRPALPLQSSPSEPQSPPRPITCRARVYGIGYTNNTPVSREVKHFMHMDGRLVGTGDLDPSSALDDRRADRRTQASRSSSRTGAAPSQVSRLPAVRVLAEALEVQRSTRCEPAYATLEEDGIVATRTWTSGTIVQTTRWQGDRSAAAARGHTQQSVGVIIAGNSTRSISSCTAWQSSRRPSEHGDAEILIVNPAAHDTADRAYRPRDPTVLARAWRRRASSRPSRSGGPNGGTRRATLPPIVYVDQPDRKARTSGLRTPSEPGG